MLAPGVVHRSVTEALALSVAMASALMVVPDLAAADCARDKVCRRDAASRRERVRVQFRSEDPEQKDVVVSLDTGDRCLTPCALWLYPGAARIAVRGIYTFRTEIEVPSYGDLFVVQAGSHRLSRWGMLLLAAGAGAIVAGFVVGSSSDCDPEYGMMCAFRDGETAAGIALLAGGTISSAFGIVSLVLSASQTVYRDEGRSSGRRLLQLSAVPTNHGASFVGVWRF
jgi:hypothetical protein